MVIDDLDATFNWGSIGRVRGNQGETGAGEIQLPEDLDHRRDLGYYILEGL